MSSVLSGSLMLALMSVPLATQDPAPTGSSPARPAASKPVPEKKICRRLASTGSILPAKECRMAAEWAAVDAQNSANADSALARRDRGGTAGR